MALSKAFTAVLKQLTFAMKMGEFTKTQKERITIAVDRIDVWFKKYRRSIEGIGPPPPDLIQCITEALNIVKPSIKQNSEKATSQTEKLSAKTRALAIFMEHPDWTDTKIAKEANISRTTLYDYPEFKTARKIQKQNKYKMPRGSKDNEGNVEAIDE